MTSLPFFLNLSLCLLLLSFLRFLLSCLAACIPKVKGEGRRTKTKSSNSSDNLCWLPVFQKKTFPSQLYFVNEHNKKFWSCFFSIFYENVLEVNPRLGSVFSCLISFEVQFNFIQ